jgi:hypothetical protein
MEWPMLSPLDLFWMNVGSCLLMNVMARKAMDMAFEAVDPVRLMEMGYRVFDPERFHPSKIPKPQEFDVQKIAA